jgi:hypothetical protein
LGSGKSQESDDPMIIEYEDEDVKEVTPPEVLKANLEQ